ncbi:MAG: hypothetical protein OJF49_002164 [Ktedonobacterales bacterium]|nr:MAG: hypothetical protein OJF49_002164 [Ktedonobacterales bacterium]
MSNVRVAEATDNTATPAGRGISAGGWLAAWISRLGLTPALVRFAALVFVVSRAGFVALTFLAQRFLPHIGHQPITSFTDSWARYDATYYARLAADGYQMQVPWRAAFFPLMPWLTHLVALPFEGLGPRYAADYIAAMVVSNVCFFVALLGLAALALRDTDGDAGTARRAILYMTLFPTALFFFAGYAESLFLMLAVWCVVALRRRAWWVAGALGLCAAMTRQVGLFLALPFAWEYAKSIGWQPRRIRANALAVCLIPCGLLVFMGWLWWHVGDPLAFEHAEHYWQHVFTPPWTTFVRAIHYFPNQHNPILHFAEVVDIFAVLLVGVLIIMGARRLPIGDTAYSAAVWLLVICYPIVGWPLLSDGRYMLQVFPAFLLLARFGRNRWLNIVVLIVFTVLLFGMTQYFVRGAVIV